MCHMQERQYFRKPILPGICTEIQKQFDVDVGSGITTNQTEGFNFLLKSLHGWYKIPVDNIMCAFHMFQRYYLKEIS